MPDPQPATVHRAVGRDPDNGGATVARASPRTTIVIAVYSGRARPVCDRRSSRARAPTPTRARSRRRASTTEHVRRRPRDLRPQAAGRSGQGERRHRATRRGRGRPTPRRSSTMGAFAAIDGPGQTPAWQQALVDNKIVCMCGTTDRPAEGHSSILAVPVADRPDARTVRLCTSLELVGKQLVGKNAEFAGDEATAVQAPRVRLRPGRAPRPASTQERVDDVRQEPQGRVRRRDRRARRRYLFDPANGRADRRDRDRAHEEGRASRRSCSPATRSSRSRSPRRRPSRSTSPNGSSGRRCSPTPRSSGARSTSGSGRTRSRPRCRPRAPSGSRATRTRCTSGSTARTPRRTTRRHRRQDVDACWRRHRTSRGRT